MQLDYDLAIGNHTPKFSISPSPKANYTRTKLVSLAFVVRIKYSEPIATNKFLSTCIKAHNKQVARTEVQHLGGSTVFVARIKYSRPILII